MADFILLVIALLLLLVIHLASRAQQMYEDADVTLIEARHVLTEALLLKAEYEALVHSGDDTDVFDKELFEFDE